MENTGITSKTSPVGFSNGKHEMRGGPKRIADMLSILSPPTGGMNTKISFIGGIVYVVDEGLEVGGGWVKTVVTVTLTDSLN